MTRSFLVDTHALLWAANDADRLGERARSILADVDNRIYVSFASLWEMSIKANLGKLDLPDDFFRQIYTSGYLKLRIEIEHLEQYRQLPLHHRDPFDRLLVAQAQTEELSVIGNDPAFRPYGIEPVW